MLCRRFIEWLNNFLSWLWCFLRLFFKLKWRLLKLILLHNLWSLFLLPLWELYVVSYNLVVIDVVVLDLI